MSEISRLLRILLDAEYGEDVRDAIHDAINRCYQDATAGMVPDITVTEVEGGHNVTVSVGDITTTFHVADGQPPTAQMDAFIAEHAGAYGETLIYDAAVTGVYLFGKNQDVAPLNDITIRQSEFDFLDIYYIFDGAGYVFTKDYRNYNTERMHVHAIATSVSGISFAQIELKLSGTHIQVRNATLTDWVSGAGPTITTVPDSYVAQTPSEYPAGYVTKIIGRKLVADAELVDARVGTEGTTYQTVGAAIRGQFENTYTKDEIDDMLDEVDIGLTAEQIAALTGLLD